MTMYGRSFGSVLDACATSFGRQEALVRGDLRPSYAEVMDGIRRTGRALRGLGLEPGDRVAFVMSDSLDLVSMMYGALWAGLTIVPLNARLQLDDHVYMVKDAGARALAFNAYTAERGHGILEQADVEFAIATDAADVPSGGLLLGDLVADQDGGPGAPEVDAESECWIQYTGGTTGFPKGALHSHRTFLSAMLSCAFELDVQPGERHVHCAPLTHSGMAYFLPVWMRGGTNILLPGFDPARLLDTIEREHATSTLMVPTMLYVLLDDAEIDKYNLTSLRTLSYGAAPMSRERLEQALDAFGPIFLQGYGQTEAPMQITVLNKRDHLLAAERPELLSSCGRPVTISEVRIAGDDLSSLPDGEVGEIVVRGPHVTLGYVNKPEETADAIRDGWLCTGDLGRRDDNGYVYIVDRKKDMIISGGFNVYPGEVEKALSTHPAVAAVCVVGVPDEKWGEAVKAVVVCEDGSTANPDDLIAFVKERKGSVMAPKSVDIVDQIPLTSVGKYDKQALRQRYWAGRERAVH
jgi:fatty-acyl-CoA synthase